MFDFLKWLFGGAPKSDFTILPNHLSTWLDNDDAKVNSTLNIIKERINTVLLSYYDLNANPDDVKKSLTTDIEFLNKIEALKLNKEELLRERKVTINDFEKSQINIIEKILSGINKIKENETSLEKEIITLQKLDKSHKGIIADYIVNISNTLKNTQDNGVKNKIEDVITSKKPSGNLFEIMNFDFYIEYEKGSIRRLVLSDQMMPSALIGNPAFSYFYEKSLQEIQNKTLAAILKLYMIICFHPFDDGNGRTARVVFFNTLLSDATTAKGEVKAEALEETMISLMSKISLPV